LEYLCYARAVARSAPLSVSQAHLAEIAQLGVPVPGYDRARLAPRIVHVGVGGFHRAHLAVYAHELASAGSDWGIAGLGLLEQDAEMGAVLRAQDHLYTLIERGAGEPATSVIGSIVGFVHAPPGSDDAVAELLAAPETAILSLTVTEGGYVRSPNPTFDRLAAALDVRRERGLGPLTILSCDNLPGNGDAARDALLTAAARAGDGAAAEWIEQRCTFPNSMVDRITPATDESDRRWLREAVGVDDRWPVVAEPFRQWVMEDAFAAGRPQWEELGVLLTDRIHDWELYKLRLLNAGHSCIAYLSALAGIRFVHEAMATPAIRTFLEDLLHHEAMPTLVEIPGHPREKYIRSVLERFANPGVRDQIARLCVDGSAKFPKFLIPSVARQLETGGAIDRSATALAGWARYLGTVEDADLAFDSIADVARRYGAEAVRDPLAFLEFDVLGPELRSSERFRAAFSRAYRRIVAEGPIAAIGPAREPAGGRR
jgi:mannitol 2-dehydrogenase